MSIADPGRRDVLAALLALIVGGTLGPVAAGASPEPLPDGELIAYLDDHAGTEGVARVELVGGEVRVDHRVDDAGLRPTSHLDPATVDALRRVLIARG